MSKPRAFDVGFVGAGNMATALARGVLGASLVEPARLCASDVNSGRRDAFREATAAVAVENNVELVRSCELVILAVKPQVADEVLTEIGPELRRSQILVSIVAGLSSSQVESLCTDPVPVVRVMPNTPALVGLGMSALAAGKHATDEHLTRVQDLFDAVGKTVVLNEDLFDALTAVSGSGPAYFFYLIESLAAAAVAEGLSADVAWTLARQTALGAATLADQSTEPVEELRRRVTSPGGTTEAALRVMSEAGFKNIVLRTVQAAARRSRELGK